MPPADSNNALVPCGRCGRHTKAVDPVCAHCGAPLKAQAPPLPVPLHQHPPPPVVYGSPAIPRRGKTVWVVLALVLLALAAAAAWQFRR